jgi:hypothetical protein
MKTLISVCWKFLLSHDMKNYETRKEDVTVLQQEGH